MAKKKKHRTDRNIRRKRVSLFFKILLTGFLIGLLLGICIGRTLLPAKEKIEITTDGSNSAEQMIETETAIGSSNVEEAEADLSNTEVDEDCEDSEESILIDRESIGWNEDWTYATFSAIHEAPVTLIRSKAVERKNIIVAVNAGHGTLDGSSQKTQCHPDGSPKVTGGSTAKGEQYAAAVSSGTTLLDGTEEAEATLDLAYIVKDKLLDAGYDVLMIRETNNCQIDNIARTVYANENADCHISLHYDSTETDKGFFYISVPADEEYRSMEPVAEHWTEHIALGEAILKGVRDEDMKIFGEGSMEIDLTQTSYSTIPSVDLEVGDRASDHSENMQQKIAEGIVNGLECYFQD